MYVKFFGNQLVMTKGIIFKILNYRHIVGILAYVALFSAACHRHVPEEEEPSVMKSTVPMESRQMDQHDRFDFQTLDTSAFYLGEIGRMQGFVKVDETAAQCLKGRFFPVDSTEWTSPVAFELLYTDGDYLFRSGTKELTLRFNVTYSPLFLTGTFYTTLLKFDPQPVSLEKYETPFFTTYHSTRNMLLDEPEELPYQIRKDVVYGRAKGYWVSNPENEDKFASSNCPSS